MMARMNIMGRSRVGLSRSGPRSAGRIGLGIVISRALEDGTAAAALSDGKSQCLRLRESGGVGLRLVPMSPNASTIDAGASGAVRALCAVSIATKKNPDKGCSVLPLMCMSLVLLYYSACFTVRVPHDFSSGADLSFRTS